MIAWSGWLVALVIALIAVRREWRWRTAMKHKQETIDTMRFLRSLHDD